MKDFRKLENLHIVFWLFKDASWAANFRALGVSMILPTLFVAIYLLIKNWDNLEERFHNLAVALWITANSLWMVGEFFKWDEAPYHLRKWCLLPFSIGILLIVIYYVFYWKKVGKDSSNVN